MVDTASKNQAYVCLAAAPKRLAPPLDLTPRFFPILRFRQARPSTQGGSVAEGEPAPLGGAQRVTTREFGVSSQRCLGLCWKHSPLSESSLHW